MDLKFPQKKVLPFNDVLAIRPMSIRIYKNGHDPWTLHKHAYLIVFNSSVKKIFTVGRNIT